MKHLSVLILYVCLALVCGAQTPFNCGTDDVYRQLIQADPSVLQRQDAFNSYTQKQKSATPHKAGPVRIIPVVFHIIHKNGPENISDAQVLDAIELLNITFRRLNANAANTRPIFQGVAADMEIEFRLARKDPGGNCTNGIVRLYHTETENGSDSIKHLSNWPADKCMGAQKHYTLYIWQTGLSRLLAIPVDSPPCY